MVLLFDASVERSARATEVYPLGVPAIINLFRLSLAALDCLISGAVIRVCFGVYPQGHATD